MPELHPISLDEIESLAIGAWILGTGGGGSPYLGLLNMRQLYAEGHRVALMDPMDLADDDLVAVVSNMGAPLVGQERLTDSRTMAKAVRMMEDYLGQKFRAIMSVEIGGNNAIQPMMGAAHLGLPVVDAAVGEAVEPSLGVARDRLLADHHAGAVGQRGEQGVVGVARRQAIDLGPAQAVERADQLDRQRVAEHQAQLGLDLGPRRLADHHDAQLGSGGLDHGALS